MSVFDRDLFVLDLANNHFGDLNHAKLIINQISESSKDLNVQIAIKFQFRDLDSFIHPEFKERLDIKYVNRFLSTRLSRNEFRELNDLIKSLGLFTMATPFDEHSVDMLEELDIDIAKVASASADDYPLLRKIMTLKRPIIASTGGLRIQQIDKLVQILESSKNEFGVMHCVSIYPSPEEFLNLYQISQLRKRFPDIPIGWSTHEDPSNFMPVVIAKSQGASIFERHVGIATENYPLNKYSSTPSQIRSWILEMQKAECILGPENRLPPKELELETLRELKRGAFLYRDVVKGEYLTEADVFYAIPAGENAFLAGEVSFPIACKKDLAKNSPLLKGEFDVSEEKADSLDTVLLQVKSILNEARVVLNRESTLEISHHYGIDKFREFGCCTFTCINREYAKKVIILLPRQKHPLHFHKKKAEAFQLLWGDLEVEVNGIRHVMKVGDIRTVEVGEWHKFQSLNGACIEEISSHHFRDDSFYEDVNIASSVPEGRKTVIASWVEVLESIGMKS
jgi:N-acetylneuraminate synthase